MRARARPSVKVATAVVHHGLLSGLHVTSRLDKAFLTYFSIFQTKIFLKN
jgi:hypothetical protein